MSTKRRIYRKTLMWASPSWAHLHESNQQSDTSALNAQKGGHPAKAAPATFFHVTKAEASNHTVPRQGCQRPTRIPPLGGSRWAQLRPGTPVAKCRGST